MNSENDIFISIIIVHYKVPQCLREALHSIYQADLIDKSEIIIVDNASNDNSDEMIKNEFSKIKWIQLKQNVGFGKACNIGVRNSRGKYILLLNPDTVINKSTLSVAFDLMESRPDIGLMGPKILNPDGTLQSSCRRSFPTPAVAIFYFTGMSKIFPKSPLFSRYHLTYKDPDTPGELDAVSGSFMFLRKDLFIEIGGFDEIFFMYGEDLDICWRIREKGYKVWYEPSTQIIHRKGRSSAKNILRSRIAFYEAMVLFIKKYRFSGIFPYWFILIGIIFQATLNIVANLIRHSAVALIDILSINVIVGLIITLRFYPGKPYFSGDPTPLLFSHFLITTFFISIFTYNGVYSKKKYSAINTFFSSLFASLMFLSSIYFVKSIAFSRIAFAISTLSISLFLVGWREIIPKLIRGFKKIIVPPERIVIIGSGLVSDKIIKDVENEKLGIISGIIWTDKSPIPGEYNGYPVIGSLNEIITIFKKNEIDMLIIATDQSWYSYIIDLLSSKEVKNITIKWVPQDLFKQNEADFPGKIPLLDFSI